MTTQADHGGESSTTKLIACLRRQAIQLPGADAGQIRSFAAELESLLAGLAGDADPAGRDLQTLETLRKLMQQHAELLARARLSVERGLDALGLADEAGAASAPERFSNPVATRPARRADLIA